MSRLILFARILTSDRKRGICRYERPACRTIVYAHIDTHKGKKVKFSHTRYRALGPELIPVYRQSARR